MKLIKLFIVALLLVTSLTAREQVNVNFSNLSINDFIKLVSKVTNKNILLSNTITGNVDFVSTTPIYKDELLDILISVLESKGFTLVKKGSLYEVVRSIDAAKNSLEFVSDGKDKDGALMVTEVIKIKNESADVVAAKIRYLLSKTAKLSTVKNTNILLITDYPRNIKTIKAVIKSIDKDKNAVAKIVPVEHSDIAVLQKELLDIARTLFNQQVAKEKVQILRDDNINSLIFIGSRKNVDKLIKIMKKLDVTANNSKEVEVYQLKNSDAKSVLESLKTIVAKQVYSDPQMKPSISANEEINSIIVVGKPAVIADIKKIIDTLDKEKFQVYVQARIININKSNSEKIGMQYGFAAGDVSPSGLYAISANFGSDALTSTALNGVLSFLGNIGSASKSGLALGAALDFLQQNGAAKEISNPSILCVNNKTSSIYVGKTISVASGQTTGTAGTTASYKREDVGLTLKIKPRVSSLERVGLEVETILGSVIDPGSATTQPITSKQTVKTEVVLRNGESIIIGGLFKTRKQYSKSKVPLLGDIPLIGEYLFSSNSTDNSTDNLVVVLTPYIISKSEKLSELQRKLGKLVNVQKEYNEVVFNAVKNQAKRKKILKQEPAQDIVTEIEERSHTISDEEDIDEKEEIKDMIFGKSKRR